MMKSGVRISIAVLKGLTLSARAGFFSTQGQVEILTWFLRMLSCQRDAPGYMENEFLRAAEPGEPGRPCGMPENFPIFSEFSPLRAEIEAH